MNIVDWAYFAGLFDGDGSIGLTWNINGRNKHLEPRICLRMTLHASEVWLLERLKNLFGGYIGPHHSKQAWFWNKKGIKKEELEYLKGFLVLKEKEAEVAIQILRLLEKRTTYGGWSNETLLGVARLGDDLFALHSGKCASMRKWTHEEVKRHLEITGQGNPAKLVETHAKLRQSGLQNMKFMHEGNRKRLIKMWDSMNEDERCYFMERSAWKNSPKIDPTTGRFLSQPAHS